MHHTSTDRNMGKDLRPRVLMFGENRQVLVRPNRPPMPEIKALLSGRNRKWKASGNTAADEPSPGFASPRALGLQVVMRDAARHC